MTETVPGGGSSQPDDLEKLYVFGENLTSSTEKSKNEGDYRGILAAASTGSSRAKLLAAQLIPRFFKFFPQLAAEGINAQLDLCEDDEVGLRVQAVRGLPFLCKDTPEHLPKLADVLCQLLVAEESQEQSVVQNSLMQVVRQNPKDALTAIFKHVENAEDNVRSRVFEFISAKIFPSRTALLVPQDKMERHVADLIKGLQDVTGDEFQRLMNFLRSLALFGEKASAERMQELLEVVEGQADLDSEFDISDADHTERLLACLQMALPLYERGANNGRFLSFINKHVLPSLEKLAEPKRIELLKSVAECSPYTSPVEARSVLPAIVEQLKKAMPLDKAESLPYLTVECLLYSFHQLAFKVPNASNPLCGYKAYTGQPSDRLGEDFTAMNEDWLKRLSVVEEYGKRSIKELMLKMAELAKEEKAATDDAAKAALKAKKSALAQELRSCTNIEKMSKVLHAKIPSFMNATTAPTLSWKPEAPAKAAGKPSAGPQKGATGTGAAQGAASTQAGGKRPGSAANGSGQPKKLRPDGQPSSTDGGRAAAGSTGGQGGRGVRRGYAGQGGNYKKRAWQTSK
eukprot:TRINITY_DN20909_c0_g2_i1.p1 TRINITY_DN20909_c0_g2~~TRINITY_DN20909_c0_g2_i1.p1  ORF type:complete len:572 (+),score=141.78 TRINITY_DN20909_c0_g2_i1:152-1867(+)